jgi:hypothetical protein
VYRRFASGAKRRAESYLGALRSGISRETRRRLALKDAEISALRRELARARGDEHGPVPAAGGPVFFVVGYQKSGTTWLMRMLDAHPEILCRGEGRFFDAGWRQKSLVKSDEKRPPSSLLYAMRDAEYLKLWIERSVWGRNDPADEHLTNLTRMAVDYFLLGELTKTNKKFVGDKSPLLTPNTLEEVSAVYPEARVLHIIRDGRDAAVSAAHHARNFGRKRSDDEPLFDEPRLRKLAADCWAAIIPRSATKTFSCDPETKYVAYWSSSARTPAMRTCPAAWRAPPSRSCPGVGTAGKKIPPPSSGRVWPATGGTPSPTGTKPSSRKRRGTCW